MDFISACMVHMKKAAHMWRSFKIVILLNLSTDLWSTYRIKGVDTLRFKVVKRWKVQRVEGSEFY